MDQSKQQSSEKLERLAVAAQEDDGAREFMNPVKPKKRGRPAGSKKKEEAPKAENVMGGEGSAPSPEESIEAIKPLMKPLWQIVNQAGVKIAETEDSSMSTEVMQVLIDTSAACVHQYLPGMLSTHANLIVLTMTLSNWGMTVYMLRMRELEKLRAMYRAQQEQEVQSEAQTLGH